jgi:hypothetical protein
MEEILSMDFDDDFLQEVLKSWMPDVDNLDPCGMDAQVEPLDISNLDFFRFDTSGGANEDPQHTLTPSQHPMFQNEEHSEFHDLPDLPDLVLDDFPNFLPDALPNLNTNQLPGFESYEVTNEDTSLQPFVPLPTESASMMIQGEGQVLVCAPTSSVTPLQQDPIDLNCRPYDSFGFLPRYAERRVERGASEDTFFGPPLYKHMIDNSNVVSIVSNGSDEDVLNIANFAIQTPGIKPKCDQALESKMHVDATILLMTKYGVSDRVSIYKRLAMLSDRVCLGCKTQRLKTVCLAGKFRCHHCVNNERGVSFENGFHQWLLNGCMSRHTSVI